MSRLLVITAVEAERDAVTRSLDARPTTIGRYDALVAQTPAGEVTVLAGGVGMAAAAAATATALALGTYDAAFSMGIAGGFDGRASVGDVVVATELVASELGADSPEGFRTFVELGRPHSAPTSAGPAVADIVRRLEARSGPILTVSTVTGTDERALELVTRWAPAAEAMEGWGVSSTAEPFGVASYEIRTISNRVGKRDRDGWEIGRALDALSAAATTLFEEPLP